MSQGETTSGHFQSHLLTYNLMLQHTTKCYQVYITFLFKQYVCIAELTEVLCANNMSVSSFENVTSFCQLCTSSRALCAPY